MPVCPQYKRTHQSLSVRPFVMFSNGLYRLFYLLMNFLPLRMTTPLYELLTRWPARL